MSCTIYAQFGLFNQDENIGETTPTQGLGTADDQLHNMYACDWHNIPLNLIGNMDEAAVWADIPADNTREVRCSKSISLLTTGYEKNYSPAMADGSMA